MAQHISFRTPSGLRAGLLGLTAVASLIALSACTPSATPSPDTTTPGATGSRSASSSPSPSRLPTTPPATSDHPAPDASATADLTITVLAKPGAKPTETRLLCTGKTAKPEATVPIADEACALVEAHPAYLFPTAKNTAQACTEQYGGPATATIKGTVRGKTVDLSLSRTDGCKISQWSTLGPLLGEAGANV
ncbi:serine protease inhibitor [Arthrobacter sp. Y-9]|uniref:serine protease inhibitor n=1 Tax=Arthrobacter sp. Y-9 TaxID=3039385 RepID=UPI00241FD505|nr:serine protease inhibitor [Arthrobacter sp. Y-9]WFR84473.1 serine protease inhibitor [Arthrobacter sp. Y-9]